MAESEILWMASAASPERHLADRGTRPKCLIRTRTRTRHFHALLFAPRARPAGGHGECVRGLPRLYARGERKAVAQTTAPRRSLLSPNAPGSGVRRNDVKFAGKHRCVRWAGEVASQVRATSRAEIPTRYPQTPRLTRSTDRGILEGTVKIGCISRFDTDTWPAVGVTLTAGTIATGDVGMPSVRPRV